MDIEDFIDKKYKWAQSPCLYIVKQMFNGNTAYRCGSSGTSLFSGMDQAYGTELSQKGLYSRLNMYKNFWLPLKGTIFACLRIPAKLVAKENERVGEDVEGRPYNINNASRTLVRVREKQMHDVMDKRSLRWKDENGKTRKNELFEPKKSVDELISCMRTINGLEMYLFNKDGPYLDPAYRGGSRHAKDTTVITEVRALPDRQSTADSKAPVLNIRLSKNNIEMLRSDDPQKFALLLTLVRGLRKK